MWKGILADRGGDAPTLRQLDQPAPPNATRLVEWLLDPKRAGDLTLIAGKSIASDRVFGDDQKQVQSRRQISDCQSNPSGERGRTVGLNPARVDAFAEVECCWRTRFASLHDHGAVGVPRGAAATSRAAPHSDARDALLKARHSAAPEPFNVSDPAFEFSALKCAANRKPLPNYVPCKRQ